MTDRSFRAALLALVVVFAGLTAAILIPALAHDNWDLWAAALDAFVNPYASAVSVDALMTYAVLALWVLHEARTHHVRRGWIALLLGLVSGVTVGLAAYLLIRSRQVELSSAG